MKVILVLALLAASTAFRLKADEQVLMEIETAGCSCSGSILGNGRCDESCNNAVCNYDDGDCCKDPCASNCSSRKLGNGVCNQECNTYCCAYDNYDCK
jgi:hypothetical protein